MAVNFVSPVTVELKAANFRSGPHPSMARLDAFLNGRFAVPLLGALVAPSAFSGYKD